MSANIGKISQVIGPVVDVSFAQGVELPKKIKLDSVNSCLIFFLILLDIHGTMLRFQQISITVRDSKINKKCLI